MFIVALFIIAKTGNNSKYINKWMNEECISSAWNAQIIVYPSNRILLNNKKNDS